MAIEGSIVAGMAGRYALAIFELARDDKSLDKVSDDLRRIRELIDGSDDLRRLVRSPVFERDLQARSMNAILDRLTVSELTQKFVGVVIENRRLFALPEIIVGFDKLMSNHKGEISVEVISAAPLEDAQIRSVESVVKNAFGRTAKIKNDVDETILGGLVVKVGSRMVDSSISTQIHNLQLAMRGA